MQGSLLQPAGLNASGAVLLNLLAGGIKGQSGVSLARCCHCACQRRRKGTGFVV